MAQYKTRAIGVVVMTVCLAIGGASVMPMVRAQSAAVDLSVAAWTQQTLQANVGKRVKLKLASGQDIEGQVAKAGAHAVVLTELTGMEFFDATVRVDQIAAVIVRRAK